MPDREAKGRERAAQRAARVAATWSRHWLARHEPLTVATPHGEVVLDEVVVQNGTDGGMYLDVYVGGETVSGDPHFRVFNPPTLVEDPAGSIEHGGRRFREDPLAALAQAIGRNGGATRSKGRRR